jgi:hypothetical protein
MPIDLDVDALQGVPKPPHGEVWAPAPVGGLNGRLHLDCPPWSRWVAYESAPMHRHAQLIEILPKHPTEQE